MRQNPIQRTASSIHVCALCSSLCTTVAHNTAQNRPDNFPSCPPDNHHCSDYVYLRERGWGRGARRFCHRNFCSVCYYGHTLWRPQQHPTNRLSAGQSSDLLILFTHTNGTWIWKQYNTLQCCFVNLVLQLDVSTHINKCTSDGGYLSASRWIYK